MKVDVLSTVSDLDAFVTRFFSKVSAEPNTGCHLWTAALNTSGYGVICLDANGRIAYAHRVAVELTGRALAVGMTVDHTCRIRSCVNPAHLDVVTFIENCRRRDVARAAPNGSAPRSEVSQ